VEIWKIEFLFARVLIPAPWYWAKDLACVCRFGPAKISRITIIVPLGRDAKADYYNDGLSISARSYMPGGSHD
jgi:hypothetical protein